MNNVKINIPIPSDLLEEFDEELKKSKWSNRSQAIRAFIEEWLSTVNPKNKYETNKDSKDITQGDAVKSVNCPTSIDINDYKLGICKKFIHEEGWGFDICLFKYIDENGRYIVLSRTELQNSDVQGLIDKLSE